MFTSIIENQNKSNIVWINYDLYADKLFNSGNKNIWQNATTFISVFKQAQTLLKSDLISIDTIPFYEQWLNENNSLIESLRKLNDRKLIRQFFSLEEPKKRITEVLKGIEHLYGNQLPIGIVIPSANAFVNIAKDIFDIEIEINARLLNSFTMYIADFLRSFSTNNITFVVIDEVEENDENYKSVINISEHYNWIVGFLNRKIMKISFPKINVEFNIADDLLKIEEKLSLENKKKGTWYVHISPNIEPEIVLDKIKLLKGELKYE